MQRERCTLSEFGLASWPQGERRLHSKVSMSYIDIHQFTIIYRLSLILEGSKQRLNRVCLEKCAPLALSLRDGVEGRAVGTTPGRGLVGQIVGHMALLTVVSRVARLQRRLAFFGGNGRRGDFRLRRIGGFLWLVVKCLRKWLGHVV